MAIGNIPNKEATTVAESSPNGLVDMVALQLYTQTWSNYSKIQFQQAYMRNCKSKVKKQTSCGG